MSLHLFFQGGNLHTAECNRHILHFVFSQGQESKTTLALRFQVKFFQKTRPTFKHCLNSLLYLWKKTEVILVSSVETLWLLLTGSWLLLTPNTNPETGKLEKVQQRSGNFSEESFHFFAGHCLSFSVERFGSNDQLSEMSVPFSDYRLRGVLWGSREGRQFCLPAVSPPPTLSFSLPLSAHHWRRLSRRASFSRMNAFATVNILSPAAPWDEQTDTNHRVDAMGRGEKQGVKDVFCCCFFCCSQLWWEVIERNRGKSDIKFKG